VADDVKLVAVDFDGVPGEWSIAAGSDESRVLVFFHGGGYCSGSIASHRRMVTEAGRCAGARTLSVSYRLAPEHPFPAAFDDALVAWRFLRRQGIAAALINRLRASGDEKPACAWLVSPWADLTMSGSTMVSKDSVDPLIHKPYLEELASAYLPATLDRKDPRVSPLFADLRGFPPVLVRARSFLQPFLRPSGRASRPFAGLRGPAARNRRLRGMLAGHRRRRCAQWHCRGDQHQHHRIPVSALWRPHRLSAARSGWRRRHRTGLGAPVADEAREV
jgi:acetyl esterase/lipase